MIMSTRTDYYRLGLKILKEFCQCLIAPWVQEVSFVNYKNIYWSYNWESLYWIIDSKINTHFCNPAFASSSQNLVTETLLLMLWICRTSKWFMSNNFHRDWKNDISDCIQTLLNAMLTADVWHVPLVCHVNRLERAVVFRLYGSPDFRELSETAMIYWYGVLFTHRDLET